MPMSPQKKKSRISVSNYNTSKSGHNLGFSNRIQEILPSAYSLSSNTNTAYIKSINSFTITGVKQDIGITSCIWKCSSNIVSIIIKLLSPCYNHFTYKKIIVTYSFNYLFINNNTEKNETISNKNTDTLYENPLNHKNRLFLDGYMSIELNTDIVMLYPLSYVNHHKHIKEICMLHDSKLFTFAPNMNTKIGSECQSQTQYYA